MSKNLLPYKSAKVADLIPYARNARTHSEAQVKKIMSSIAEFGFINPVITDGKNGIIAGHGRVMAAERLGMEEVPTVEAAHLTEAQKRAYILADNRLALDAGWDDEILRVELIELQDAGFDLSDTGFDLKEVEALIGGLDDEDGDGEPSRKDALSDKFLMPPFTVLNAREGKWQDRKRSWIAMGIKSELGRGDELLGFSSAAKAFGRYNKAEPNEALEQGTSIFDPVLCELAYTWFSPQGGLVLDPFAGGSVRGVVASKLGRRYIGVDLRGEQVEANREQGEKLCEANPPAWIAGDSRNIASLCEGVEADFVFSCPPYADLEVYSDNPADISTLGYTEFKEAYFEIIKNACGLLKNNRFACFVVGDVRDKKGNYYNFVSDTIGAFLDAGLKYYNEAILVTAVGSLPIRVGKQFSGGRKLGKTHQNILVFVKGDGKKAAEACGAVEVYVPEDGGGGEHTDLGEQL